MRGTCGLGAGPAPGLRGSARAVVYRTRAAAGMGSTCGRAASPTPGGPPGVGPSCNMLRVNTAGLQASAINGIRGACSPCATTARGAGKPAHLASTWGGSRCGPCLPARASKSLSRITSSKYRAPETCVSGSGCCPSTRDPRPNLQLALRDEKRDASSPPPPPPPAPPPPCYGAGAFATCSEATENGGMRRTENECTRTIAWASFHGARGYALTTA
jgi:hypothetical protein